MTYEHFQELCKEPVDVSLCKEALSRLLDHKCRMSVPVQLNDDDVLIMRAINELERIRGN